MYDQGKKNRERNRINGPACESPTGCGECSFAWQCHEQRTGQAVRFAWPVIVLAVLAVVALFV